MPNFEVKTMTALLQKAFKAASKLPKKEQDILATLLLEELQSEKRWAKAFEKSQDKLAVLADEALAEFQRGETQPLDPDAL
jgi:hypothetical protein